MYEGCARRAGEEILQRMLLGACHVSVTQQQAVGRAEGTLAVAVGAVLVSYITSLTRKHAGISFQDQYLLETATWTASDTETWGRTLFDRME